ncbi:hypothetical protein HHK36_022881 [Tetracentron sinense]|uniref:Uncharacterized protein n=2 Tax=Magnoliopsida TaxID=3398 RepID=A0A835D776_TETSI|nr:hypothetical protein HHK36_022881 [Tetracentron sinense]
MGNQELESYTPLVFLDLVLAPSSVPYSSVGEAVEFLEVNLEVSPNLYLADEVQVQGTNNPLPFRSKGAKGVKRKSWGGDHQGILKGTLSSPAQGRCQVVFSSPIQAIEGLEASRQGPNSRGPEGGSETKVGFEDLEGSGEPEGRIRSSENGLKGRSQADSTSGQCLLYAIELNISCKLIFDNSVQIILVSMVCALGKGRMAAMVRLLATVNHLESTAEEASYEKLAAQSIRRELREADEANLLEEEDMHVFDCKPMSDPLHLVCCNACKKPVRASQYAAHADQVTTVGEQERSESIDADDTAASESNLEEQTGMSSSFSREAKGNSTSIDGASVMNGSGVSPGSTNYSAGVMSPSRKRTKLIAAAHLLLSDDVEKACGVSKNTGASCQEALTCGKFPKGSIAGREKPFDYVGGCQKPGQVLEHSPSTKDVPLPLATKMYYCQRNHRLRSALNHLYYEASTKEQCSDSRSPEVLQGNVMLPSQASSLKNLSHEQMDGLAEKKKDAYTLPAVRKPDQILAQSSELCLGNSGGYPSSMNFSNQFQDSNFLRSALSVDAAPTGMMRSRYLPTPYSFSANSGTSLGTLQQPNGSVPVI